MLNTEELRKKFEDVQPNDPKIKIGDSSIVLIPTYLNYVFLLNFIPGLAGIYVLTQQNDLKINLGCFFLIGLSLYGILSQLSFYNKIIINIETKTIIVIPNIFKHIFKKKTVISFKDIQYINFYSNGFGASHIRYVIEVKLKDTQQIKIISSAKRDNAEKIVKALLKII